MKHVIFALSVGVLIGGSLVWGWYSYIHKKEFAQVQSVTTARMEPNSPGRLLPYLSYEKMYPYEKSLVQKYLQANPNFVASYMDYWKKDPEMKPNPNPAEEVFLKYYDDSTMVVGVISCKDSCFYPLEIYDINSMQKISTKPFVTAGGHENEDYIVSLFSDYETKEYLMYYKKGDRDFNILPKSEVDSKKETYVEAGGIGGPAMNISFLAGQGILDVDVFDSAYNDGNGKSTKKTRTATFGLP